MSIKHLTRGLLLATTTTLAGVSVQAQDIDRVEAGQLKCDVEGGVGLILGSKKKMACTFERKDGGTETYTGRVTKVGLDIGATKDAVIWWLVLAPAEDTPAGALAGEYVGIAAEATVGAGAGANLLVGGGDKSFALQPLSLGTQKGLNIAGGLASIKLEYGG